MYEYSLPFPSKELAYKELSYDACYNKIPVEDRNKIVAQAWEKGANAAKEVFLQTNGEHDFFVIAKQNGLSCVYVDKDYIVGNQRYFSDYISGQNKINLYVRSIALWAKENNLSEKNATHIILSHEYYHFLEWTKLGLTSKLYSVPMLKIGPFSLGKTGIRALSEIGAHAFAHTYYEQITQKGEN